MRFLRFPQQPGSYFGRLLCLLVFILTLAAEGDEAFAKDEHVHMNGYDMIHLPSLPTRDQQLLIQDVGLDSVALATLVVEGALGKDGADPSITEAFHWWVSM